MSSTSQQKIPFTCPHCGHYTEVDVKFAGRSGPCVGCNNIIAVPTLESVAAPATTIVKNQTRPDEKPIWIKIGMGLGAVMSLAVIGIVVWAFLRPAFAAAKSAAMCTECESNLRVIGAALEDYYEDKGHYPPAMTYDENGKPLHSWRVLLLPYLGPQGQQLADQIKMNEPFDSKHNSLFVDQMPDVYHCPADDAALPGETSYLAVVGDNTLINTEKPASRKAGYDGPVLRDHPSETMVVIEAEDCSVNWMKPKDLTITSLSAGLNSSNPTGPGSNHMQGVNILMADQSIIRLTPESVVNSDDLRGMATIDGGNEYIEVLDEIEY